MLMNDGPDNFKVTISQISLIFVLIVLLFISVNLFIHSFKKERDIKRVEGWHYNETYCITSSILVKLARVQCVFVIFC